MEQSEDGLCVVLALVSLSLIAIFWLSRSGVAQDPRGAGLRASFERRFGYHGIPRLVLSALQRASPKKRGSGFFCRISDLTWLRAQRGAGAAPGQTAGAVLGGGAGQSFAASADGPKRLA